MGKIILFYKYVDIENPHTIEKWQRSLCTELRLKGRIILAREGINGTLGGSTESIERYKSIMLGHTLFGNIDFKESLGNEDYFPRLRIVIKNEIVHLGIDPESLKASQGGIHLAPAQAHTLIAQKPDNLVIIDCRNNFESAVGTMPGAICPDTKYFRDFPAYVDQHPALSQDAT